MTYRQTFSQVVYAFAERALTQPKKNHSHWENPRKFSDPVSRDPQIHISDRLPPKQWGFVLSSQHFAFSSSPSLLLSTPKPSNATVSFLRSQPWRSSPSLLSLSLSLASDFGFFSDFHAVKALNEIKASLGWRVVYAWVGDDPCGDGELPPWSGVTCSTQGDYRVVTEL